MSALLAEVEIDMPCPTCAGECMLAEYDPATGRWTGTECPTCAGDGEVTDTETVEVPTEVTEAASWFLARAFTGSIPAPREDNAR